MRLSSVERGDRNGRDVDACGARPAGAHAPGFLWPIYGDRDEVVFHWARSRAHRHACEFRGDCEGTLLSDGYGAYLAYAKVRAGFVTHAQCWSHARRGFEVAQGAEPRLAGEALALMGAPYREEKRIREKGLGEPRSWLAARP